MKNTNSYKFNIERSIFFLPEKNQLLVGDVSIRMEPLQVKLLQVLIENHGNVMSVSHLASLVWQRENVSDNLVRQVISQLRTHLSDNERPHKIIQTIPKKGYFLLPEVLCIDDVNMVEKERPLSIKEDQPNSRYGYKKTIMMMACFASLMISVYSVHLYFKKNISNSEPLSIYLSSSISADKIDTTFIASMQNYIYYTLRTTKNINVFLQKKITTQLDQHKKTYHLITNYHQYSNEYKLTIDIYDHQNIFMTTFSTTFSKSNFLLNLGSLTLDIKEYLSPNTTNHSIFFKQEKNTHHYNEWADISDGVVGLYQGNVKSTINVAMPKLIALKENGNNTYLVNALLAYSYSVKYLKQHDQEDKKTALQLAKLAFSQDPLCDISNVSLGLALIINNKATEAYPYLYYAVENSASPLSYYLISLSADLSGNKLGSARYKEKFMKMNQQAGGDFELSITEPYNQ